MRSPTLPPPCRLPTARATLISALRHFGYRTAIISGGFTHVGDRLQRELGIDYVHANALETRDGVVTGEVVGDIIDAERKASLLRALCRNEGIALAQSIAIGDGANDLPMSGDGGAGVAFHAKPIVRESASHAISNFGLDSVLFLMGFTDRDIEQAAAKRSIVGGEVVVHFGRRFLQVVTLDVVRAGLPQCRQHRRALYHRNHGQFAVLLAARESSS